MIRYLRDQFLASRARTSRFSSCGCSSSSGRARAMIALFLAVLEMVRMQAVVVTQKDLFGEIAAAAAREASTRCSPPSSRWPRSRRITSERHGRSMEINRVNGVQGERSRSTSPETVAVRRVAGRHAGAPPKIPRRRCAAQGRPGSHRLRDRRAAHARADGRGLAPARGASRALLEQLIAEFESRSTASPSAKWPAATRWPPSRSTTRRCAISSRA